MDNYKTPAIWVSAFNCPHCMAYSNQYWGHAHSASDGGQYTKVTDFAFSACLHCKQWSCWYNGTMIMPGDAPVARAHPDMPDGCKQVYDEARNIAGQSPKAAAALIRLALQLLMKDLGEKGDHIDTDIQRLVDKGLDTHIQEALDYCRVVGNQAVHPGSIQLDDDPNIAYMLFEMLNLIVEERIARPARVRAAVAKLPEEARNKIEARAAKNKAP
ncbi:DUF4145 domain-containing protein [Ectopseudomonas khazarica]|uniref:DUF4145 domain-containing protein n=1 Tax=Ectopseudomonas khazarica TaxID=2502979 RepID=UPI003B94B078